MPDRHLYPTPDFPALQLGPDGGVPLGWLDALRQEAMTRVRAIGGATATPADQARVQREVDSIRVYGVQHLTARYADELTEVEKLRDDLAAATAGLLSLRQLYDENGQLRKDPDVAAKLRAVIWADYVTPPQPTGTDAPAAPPAAPNTPPPPAQPETREQRIQRWRDHNAAARWKLPGDSIAAMTDAQRMGIALDEVAEAEGVTPDSITGALLGG